MPLTAGTRLGVYEIRSLLGAGGIGEVYRARDTRLNRDVAIKIVQPWRDAGGRFETGPERTLTELSVGSGWTFGTPFDAAADGRLLALVRTQDAQSSSIRVVLGWDRDVSRLWSSEPR